MRRILDLFLFLLPLLILSVEKIYQDSFIRSKVMQKQVPFNNNYFTMNYRVKDS